MNAKMIQNKKKKSAYKEGDERASPLVTGLWVVKENGLDSDSAISQQG